jgi:hypothetical protein
MSPAVAPPAVASSGDGVPADGVSGVCRDADTSGDGWGIEGDRGTDDPPITGGTRSSRRR